MSKTKMSTVVRTVLASAVLMGAQMASAQVEAGSVIRLGTSLPGNGTLLSEVAETVLSRMAQNQPFERLKMTATKSGQFKYDFK